MELKGPSDVGGRCPEETCVANSTQGGNLIDYCHFWAAFWATFGVTFRAIFYLLILEHNYSSKSGPKSGPKHPKLHVSCSTLGHFWVNFGAVFSGQKNPIELPPRPLTRVVAVEVLPAAGQHVSLRTPQSHAWRTCHLHLSGDTRRTVLNRLPTLLPTWAYCQVDASMLSRGRKVLFALLTWNVHVSSYWTFSSEGKEIGQGEGSDPFNFATTLSSQPVSFDCEQFQPENTVGIYGLDITWRAPLKPLGIESKPGLKYRYSLQEVGEDGEEGNECPEKRIILHFPW